MPELKLINRARRAATFFIGIICLSFFAPVFAAEYTLDNFDDGVIPNNFNGDQGIFTDGVAAAAFTFDSANTINSSPYGGKLVYNVASANSYCGYIEKFAGFPGYAPRDISAFEEIHFWVKSDGVSTTKFYLEINDDTWNTASIEITGVNSTWQQKTVVLSGMSGYGSLDKTKGRQTAFILRQNQVDDTQGTLYFEEIHFVDTHNIPLNITTSPSDQQVMLKWGDVVVSGLQGYNVYRSTTSGGPYTKINTSLVSLTEYLDSGLTNNTTYYYVVRSVVSGVESANSAQASAMPKPMSAYIIDDFNDGTIPNNWNGTQGIFNDLGGVASFIFDNAVYYGSSGASAKIDYNVNTAGSSCGYFEELGGYPSFTLTDLTGYEGFRFWIKGDTTSGFTTKCYVQFSDDTWDKQLFEVTNITSDWKEIWVDLNDKTNPDVDWTKIRQISLVFKNSHATVNQGAVYVDDLRLIDKDNIPLEVKTVAGDTQVLIKWKEVTANGLQGYNVYRSTTSGGPYTKINASPFALAEYTDTTVANYATYYYAVASVVGGIESPYSAERSAFPIMPANYTFDSFDDGTPPNNFNGEQATFADGGSSVTFSFDSAVTHNGSPYSGKVVYDVSTANSVCGYVERFGGYPEYAPRDLSAYDEFNFWVKGDAATSIMRLEFSDDTWNKAEIKVTGITTAWKEYVIQLSDLAGYANVNWTKMRQMAFLFKQTEVDDTQGAIYLDGIHFVDKKIIPLNVNAKRGDAKVYLAWDDMTKSDLSGFNIYRSTTGGGPYIKVNASLITTPNYTDTAVANGTTYYYVATSRSAGIYESGYSNETFVTPNPFTYFSIPSCAWNRTLGDIPAGSASKVTDRGVALGGFGAGSFMYGLTGSFGPWYMDIKYYDNRYSDEAAFHIYEKKGSDAPKVKCLSTKPKEQTWERISTGDAQYYGLQPKGWVTYQCFNADVSQKFFSPIIAHNYKETSYPVAVWQWKVSNPTNENIDIAIMLTLPQVPYGEKTRTGFKNSVKTDGNITAIVLKATDPANVSETQNSEWCIATRSDTGVTVSYVTSWNKDLKYPDSQRGADIWNDFKDDGVLSNGTLDDSDSAAAIVVKTTLAPGQVKEIPIVVSWDFPVIRFKSATDGTEWWRKYTEYFDHNADNSFDIAVEALNNYTDWEAKIDDWMDPIINNVNYPDWLKCAAFNELYFQQFSGVFYESGLKSGHEQEFMGLHVEDHKNFVMEGVSCPWASTFDVRHYSDLTYARLWPQMERDFLRSTADAIEYYDADNDPSTFMTPHDMGNPWEDPYFKFDDYGRRLTSQWKDLHSKFIQQCYRYYSLYKDEEFLNYVWPSIKHVYQFMKTVDTDGDYLPNNNSSDNTYDSWGFFGTGIYCGGLWVGALDAMDEMATHLGDPISAEVETWLSSARTNLDTQLWSSTLGYYKLDSQKDDIMTDALNGAGYALAYNKLDGTPLADILPRTRMVSHLQQVYNRCVLPLADLTGDGKGDFGAVNGRRADGTWLEDWKQGSLVWGGVTYFTSAIMYRLGLTEEALQSAYGVYYTTYKNNLSAYWFNTPEGWKTDGTGPVPDYEHQYQRPRAVWELVYAIVDPYSGIAVFSPTGLKAIPQSATSVNLTWDKNFGINIAGYNVYRSLTHAEGYTKVNTSLITANSYLNTGLITGTTYYYVVSAVTTGSVESGYSTETTAIPVSGYAPVTINVPADYPTIQQAINAAKSGDTVQIAAGTYNENLLLKDGIKIHGAGTGATVLFGSSGKIVSMPDGVSSQTEITGITIDGLGYASVGIDCQNSQPKLYNNIITNINGNGIECNFASPDITNNIISYTATAVNIYSGNPTVVNNTIGNNEIGVNANKSSAVIKNNIIINNSVDGIHAINSTLTINYNDIWGNALNYNACTAGPNDVSADPLLVGEGDYHLKPVSSCINAGDPNAAYNDPSGSIDGARNDMGSYGAPGARIGLAAEAGKDQASLINTLVALDGSKSDYPNGVIGSAYRWAQTAGPSVTLSNAQAVKPAFTPAAANTYTFQLKTTDGTNYSAVDTVTITVRAGNVTISVPSDYSTVQEGVDAAMTGDTVQVAAGAYNGNIVLKNGVKLIGAGRDVTTLTANSGIVVYVPADSDPSTKIEGFTIDGSGAVSTGIFVDKNSARTINNNTVQNSASYGIYCDYNSKPAITSNNIRNNHYNGIFCEHAAPTISNNTISNNQYYGIWANASSPLITGNTITNNDSGIYMASDSKGTISGNQIIDNNGFGVRVDYSAPTISGNTIKLSQSYTKGNADPADDAYNVGIYCIDASPSITGNTFTNNHWGINLFDFSGATVGNNTFTANGDGVNMQRSSDSVIRNNTIKDSEVHGIRVHDCGPLITGNNIDSCGDSVINSNDGPAGILLWDSNAMITNNVVTNCWPKGISYINSNPIIANNTISYNQGDGIGGFRFSPIIVNNTITNNTQLGINHGSEEARPSYATAIYNNVWNNTWTNYAGCMGWTGSISADPLFVNPAAGDYRLKAGSPCINTGLDKAEYITRSPFVGRAPEIGAYETAFLLTPPVVHVTSPDGGEVWGYGIYNILWNASDTDAGNTITGIAIQYTESSNQLIVEDFNDAIDDPNQLGGSGGTWIADEGQITTSFINSGAYRNAGYSKQIDYNVASKFISECGYWSGLLGADLTSYGELTFEVKGLNGGEPFTVGLKDNASPSHEYKIPITNYLPNGVTTDWQRVVIPLSAFIGPDLSNIGNISFTFNHLIASPRQGTIYIDEVRFLKWVNIAAGEANDGVYPWNTAGLPEGNRYLIKVKATDSDGITGEDQTDDYFCPNKPVVTVIQPNGGEIYSGTQPIAWTATYEEPIIGVDIQYNNEAQRVLVDDFNDGSDPNLWECSSGTWGNNVDSYYNVNSENVRGGTGYSRQQVYDASSGTCGLWIGLWDNHNVISYENLSFWVKGAVGGEKFYVGLKDWANAEAKVPVDTYLKGGVSTYWQEVVIPLTAFGGLDLTNPNNFSITFDPALGEPVSGAVYIDDLRFAKWMDIVTGLANTGNYIWDTTTVADGNAYLVKIIAKSAEAQGTDESNAEFTVSNGSHAGMVSGKVSIQGRANNSEIVAFELRQPGQTTPLYTHQVITASDGSYSLTDIPAGIYDLTAKSSNTLRAKNAGIIITAGQTASGINFSILGGDADNNNVVSLVDFAILRAAKSTKPGDAKWDPRADFNANSQIDLTDFSILRSNSGKSGAQ